MAFAYIFTWAPVCVCVRYNVASKSLPAFGCQVANDNNRTLSRGQGQQARTQVISGKLRLYVACTHACTPRNATHKAQKGRQRLKASNSCYTAGRNTRSYVRVPV